MELTLTPTLVAENDFAQLATSRQPLVSEEINVSTAKGTWDFSRDDGGRPLLLLNVRDDFNGEAHGQFAPEELRNEEHLRLRLHDMKGALLRVGQWRASLQRLFDDIRAWLGHLSPAPYVEERQRRLVEQRSGPYEVTTMRIARGGRECMVTPIACWIVGADGRVDLKGTEEDFVLVLQGGDWFWVEQRRLQRLPQLNRDLFLELLQASMGESE